LPLSQAGQASVQIGRLFESASWRYFWHFLFIRGVGGVKRFRTFPEPLWPSHSAGLVN